MYITFLTEILLSGFSLVLVLTLSILIKRKAKKIQENEHLSRTRYYMLKKIINIFSVTLLLTLLIFIWGINIKSLWVSISGILAMIAVAFFAVWSLVGNILAGIILYFTAPFKLGDRIEVLPDNIKGKVLAINTFFSLIQDEEGNLINIPNSLFFQKFVKKIKK